MRNQFISFRCVGDTNISAHVPNTDLKKNPKTHLQYEKDDFCRTVPTECCSSVITLKYEVFLRQMFAVRTEDSGSLGCYLKDPSHDRTISENIGGA